MLADASVHILNSDSTFRLLNSGFFASGQLRYRRSLRNCFQPIQLLQ
jgi:hypothetical protein